MAYENMTYEVILQRMMNRVKEKYPNLDMREGSIIFNALAPAAVELAIMYTEIDSVLSESFAATASREYLLLACEQIGIDTSRFDASVGTHSAIFNEQVPIGSRWNCDIYNYVVVDYMGCVGGLYGDEYYYKLQSETAGSAPNLTGNLTPINYTPMNLTLAQLTGYLTPGEDEASDEDIRKTYFDYVNNIASDGNVAQYLRWCDEFDGIGKAKIIPVWSGANTVKVSILDATNRAANGELMQKFQEYIDPNAEGMGNGVAPIGAKVTVSTATEVPIDISAKIRWKDGIPNQGALNESLTDYFAQIAYTDRVFGEYDIAVVLINTGAVVSIRDITINGSATQSVSLGVEEIPVLGTTTWTVE